MNVKFSGFENKVVTLKCNSTVNTPGQLVKMAGNRSVTKCSSSDIPIGVVVSVNNYYAAIQIKGCIEVPHNGTVTCGYHKLSAATDTMLKSDDTYGREMLILDAASGKATIII